MVHIIWKAAQEPRLGQRIPARGNLRGRKAKYLLSGLLTCSECGSHYVIQTDGRYGCTAHANRGDGICPNGALVRRERPEETILRLVFEEVFSSETLAYLADGRWLRSPSPLGMGRFCFATKPGTS
jgi:Recombinase zinc beta ribbon domain